MVELEMDRFESWVRGQARGCMDDHEIAELVRGEFDIDGTGGFVFSDAHVQSQWEAWQAAIQATCTRLREWRGVQVIKAEAEKDVDNEGAWESHVQAIDQAIRVVESA